MEGPVKASFPVLIDMPVPVIKAYSKESALAEKLEAIAYRGITTSRMKDFFDILYLAAHSDFSIKTLKNAIAKTFAKRDTKIANIGLIFEKEFRESKEKQSQWEAFLRRNRIDSSIRFSKNVELLEPFMKPLYDESIKENKNWNKKDHTWE